MIYLCSQNIVSAFNVAYVKKHINEKEKYRRREKFSRNVYIIIMRVSIDESNIL